MITHDVPEPLLYMDGPLETPSAVLRGKSLLKDDE
jgi:hypothetical protein